MDKVKRTVLNILGDFSKGAKRYFFIALIAAAIGILFNFIMQQLVGFTVDSLIGDEAKYMPGILSKLVNSLIGNGFSRDLLICVTGIALCAAVSGMFNYLSRISIAVGTERFSKKMRDALFSHTQHMPFSWHNDNLTGDIIQRCTSDVEMTRNFVSRQLLEVCRTIILVTIALIIMFSMNVKMSLLILAFIPIILLYTVFFYSRISRKFLTADEAEGELMVKVQENLTGVRVVRAFGREKYELDRFDEKNDSYAKKWIDLGYTLGIYWGLGDIVSASQLLAVVSVGAYLAAQGELTLGSMIIFISYTHTIAWPVRQLGRTLSEMSKAGVSLRRIKEILDAPPEPEGNALQPPIDRDIIFDNVTFSYGGRTVLKNFSFTIKSGTTFGILGATGSGKSTITYLLNRLYDLPEGSGSITVGGVDIRDIDRRYLRRNIGLVLQEPFLFSKTIFENIDIAAMGGDMNAVRKSAAVADIDDNIISFPKGYDTIVGERGVTLSGGQKQRVAIARTLMMECPVMIFDDSMSNLDMETDAAIREALRENTEGKTAILISHRISTLMQADVIMVIEDGRLIEIGSHSELIQIGRAHV